MNSIDEKNIRYFAILFWAIMLANELHSRSSARIIIDFKMISLITGGCILFVGNIFKDYNNFLIIKKYSCYLPTAILLLVAAIVFMWLIIFL